MSAWTDGLREKVSALWSNHSATEIAAVLWEQDGLIFSRNAVVGLLHRMGKTSEHKSQFHPMTRPKGSAPRIRLVASNFPRKTPRPSAETIRLRCVEIVPLHKTLLELEKGECRYAYGDSAFTFCGHPAKPGSSYCMSHHDLCWVPASRNLKGPNYLPTDLTGATLQRHGVRA